MLSLHAAVLGSKQPPANAESCAAVILIDTNVRGLCVLTSSFALVALSSSLNCLLVGKSPANISCGQNAQLCIQKFCKPCLCTMDSAGLASVPA